MKRNFSLSSIIIIVASLLVLSLMLSSCSSVSKVPTPEDNLADTNDNAADKPEENDSKKPENNDGNHEATDDGDIDIDCDGRPGSDNNGSDIVTDDSDNQVEETTRPGGNVDNNDNTTGDRVDTEETTEKEGGSMGGDIIEDLVFVIEGTVVKGLTEYGKTLHILQVPDGITEIGARAFENCTNIRSISLPEGIVTIGDKAFYGCNGIVLMTIPDSVTTIGANAFTKTNLVSITLGSGITTFNTSANTASFTTGGRMKEVYNRSSVVTNKYGFYESEIDNIYTSENGESKIYVDDEGFVFYTGDEILKLVGYCGDKSAIELPGYQNGEDYRVECEAFSIVGITGVNVSEAVSVIDRAAFDECFDLADIKLPEKDLIIGVDAFYDTAYYNDPANWDGGLLYIGKHLVCSNPYDYEIASEIVIKEGTLTIANRALGNCKTITKLVLTDGIIRIGDGAFYNCTALAEITFPTGIQYIPSNILDNTAYYKSCESNYENACTGVYVGEYFIKAIYAEGSIFTIAEGTTYVAMNAMNMKDNAYVKTIVVPSSIKVLEEGSLYLSDRLSKVYYSGTIEQWNSIDNGGCFEGFGGTSITIICDDGNITYTPGN